MMGSVAWYRVRLAEVEAERDDALDALDRARDLAGHLEIALDDAMCELAEVRDRLAEMRLRLVGP